MKRRQVARAAICALVVLSASVPLSGYLSAEFLVPDTAGDPSVERAFETGERDPVAGPRDGITVVATDSTAFVTEEGDGPRAQAELVAFAPDGSILYYDDAHTRYWDVDPVEGTRSTVEYVYADHLSKADCGADTVCTRNGVERVNLTTGDATGVYSRITPGKHSTRWHDADRIDDRHLAVADIDRDRVYVVDVRWDLIVWEWDALSEFSPASGGPFPDDWTHVNDVEVLPDGRLMASLRNHDQVVFLDRERGLRANWTLGSDGDHGTLYEQHNPDYVPRADGGPGVIVADSENGRVVEYERSGDDWERTWTWQDERLQWPRDADRLPSGNTLVTDSNGDRVIEVDEHGEVVWSVDVGFPYEAERLNSGPESAGGPSAERAGLDSRTVPPDEATGWSRLEAVLPKKTVNGIVYLLPGWMGLSHAAGAVLAIVLAFGWIALEWRWADLELGVRSPVRVRRR